MAEIENKTIFPILIVGSSVRAAVWSAKQVGIPCLAADQFGDADLLEMVQSHDFVSADFHELPLLLDEKRLGKNQISGWCYTGGLENQSRLIGECAQKIPVWGNGQGTVEAIRDPFVLQKVVSQLGFQMPKLKRVEEGLAGEEAKDWLLKRIRSGGGLTVQPIEFSGAESIDLAEPELQNLQDDSYLQCKVEGVPVSVSFLAAAGECALLGCVEQFTVGSSSLPFSMDSPMTLPYLFAGGITRDNFSEQQCRSLIKLGKLLVTEFRLQGVFGVDFILDSTGELWCLEVNPRYTATMELLERFSGLSFMKLHVDSFSSGFELTFEHVSAAKYSVTQESDRYVAKQIVYAQDTVAIPEDFVPQCDAQSSELPLGMCCEIVDVPHSGEIIPAGNPVCTVISRGETRKICLSKLVSGMKQACIVLESKKK